MAAHVYHYRHGWIPIDHADAPQAAGITNSQDLHRAILGLPEIKDNQSRMAAKLDIRRAAVRLGIAARIPGDTPITRRLS